jgi:hypothetical protein
MIMSTPSEDIGMLLSSQQPNGKISLIMHLYIVWNSYTSIQ